jgi:catechol 2,3-dioxygenase
MSLTGVLRPGHIQIRVTDLAGAVRHYAEVIGLDVVLRGADGRVYLKAWDEFDHHSVILREADTPGMDFLGFKVASDEALTDLGERVRRFGLAVEEVPAGEMPATGRRLRFTCPTGHTLELFADKQQIGNGLGTVNPEVKPETVKGMKPTRFDHCLLYGDDIDANLALFTEVLGFHLTERVIAGDGKTIIGTFLSCSNKPHDIAFIRSSDKGRFHHVSFCLESWNDIGNAADIIARHKVPLDIGPTRHGITRGYTIYFFDPSGNRNEVFSGGYQYYPDNPMLEWTEAELGRAIFYYDRKLNERFLSVTT